LADVGSNPEFVFIVKLFRGFTHTMRATKQDILSIHAMLHPLAMEGKLEGIIIQFPYGFSNLPERRQYLNQLGSLFRQYRMFIEVRHRSWNTPGMLTFLRECGFHIVNTDLPQIRQHIPLMSEASPEAAYFRMMGRNARSWMTPWRVEADGKHMISDRYNYSYSREELEGLVALLARVQGIARKSFVVFHNDPEANSLINGFQLTHMLRHDRRIQVPRNFLDAFPALQPICLPERETQSLFSD